MRCEEEGCLAKCEYCSKIAQPPGECTGCGQTYFDMVQKGELEKYLLKHSGAQVVTYSGGFWVVRSEKHGAFFLKRNMVLVYYGKRRIDPYYLEMAVDTIQIYNILNPQLVRNVMSEHVLNKELPQHRYAVTYPVHQTIRGIAEKFGVTMTDLFTAFVDYISMTGVRE